VARRPACLGSRDVGGAVAVAGDDADVVVVVVVVAAGGDVAAVAAAAAAEDVEGGVAGGAGRTDTCSDLSCGCPSQSAVLVYKTGRARWNMRWKIATEDVGSTDPGMCELACRRAARGQFQGVAMFKVVSGGGCVGGRHNGRLDGNVDVSLSHASRKARTRWSS
jgi:hypothetical protein